MKFFRKENNFKKNKIISRLVKNKLSKSYNIFLKSSFLFVIFQILVISFFYIEAKERINNRFAITFKEILSFPFDTLNPKDYLEYFKDFYFSFYPKNSLERINLNLNYESIIGLECTREINNNCVSRNAWFSGEMIDNKNKFRVKLKSKGYRRIHKKDFKSMSFKVDIKGEKRYQGMEEFSLQAPFIRNYLTEPLMARLLRNEGIISPRNKYVRLYINGEYLGIRHLEETYSKELIENNQKRYGPERLLPESGGRP